MASNNASNPINPTYVNEFTATGLSAAQSGKSQAAQTYFNQQINGMFQPQLGAPAAGHGFKTTKDDGKVDWAKFAMWLRGFLAAVEGQPLTPETVAKIMDKLATVDPDRQLSYNNNDYDFLKAIQNIPVYPQPAAPTYPWPSTIGPLSAPPASGTITWKGKPTTSLSEEDFRNILGQELNSLKPGWLTNSIYADVTTDIVSPNINSGVTASKLSSKLINAVL